MDRLYGASIFTKLDLWSWYWQIQIAEDDEHKTTCVTRYDSYKFLVMSFDLTTFCNPMNDVLYDFLDNFVIVYLDEF
jgi:hypothetical protein